MGYNDLWRDYGLSMKVHVMPDLRFNGIYLPGGWQVGVPEIEVDQETTAMVQQAGLPVHEFGAAMQMIFERGMLKHIRDYMRYWSKVYRKMCPDLWDKENGALAGFDPEDLMRYWLPSERAWGKDNVQVRYQLAEYAREERRQGDE